MAERPKPTIQVTVDHPAIFGASPDSAALPETRVERLRRAATFSRLRTKCYSPNVVVTADELIIMLDALADRDRLQRRVEELEEQIQRVATVAQAFGESRQHMDGLERCGQIARAALTAETPHV